MGRFSLLALMRVLALVALSVGLFVVGSFVGAAAPARADANDEARFYFERGNEILQDAMRARGARRRTLLRDAVAQYLEAVARVRSKNAIYNIALCYQELGEPEEAWTYFHEYRSMVGVSDDERAEADRRLAALAPRVALVEVTSTPPGAEVRVDRPDLASRGRTPLVIPVEPGERRILVRLAGHALGEETVTAVQGEQRTVGVTLRPEMVRVVIESVPAGATVTLDGRPIGRTPIRGRTTVGSHQIRLEHGDRRIERRIEVGPEGGTFTERFEAGGGVSAAEEAGRGALLVTANVGDAEITVDSVAQGRGRARLTLPPGLHEVAVTAPGWAPYRGTVSIVAGQERRVTVTLRLGDGGSTLGILPELTLGFAGVALVGAIVMSAYATAENDRLDTLQTDWGRAMSLISQTQIANEARTLEDEIDSRNLLADVMWGSTVALTGLAILLFVLDEPDADAGSRATIGAAPIPGGGLAALRLVLPGEAAPRRRPSTSAFADRGAR